MFDLPDAPTSVLLGATAIVAVVHALLGVDHSLPFIVLGRTRGWSIRRTVGVSAGCGLVHVAASVAIGAAGAIAGLSLDTLEWFDSVRGTLAAAVLFGFGLSYAAVALWRFNSRTGSAYGPTAATCSAASPASAGADSPYGGTGPDPVPWALGAVLLIGPCEPLIPILLAVSLSRSWLAVGSVVCVFAVLTATTMASAVALGCRGLAMVPVRRAARYGDLVAGLIVAASGVAVWALGAPGLWAWLR